MADLMSGIQGAGSGASLGTMIAPGVGTLIGGALGGLVGLFGKRGKTEEEKALAKLLSDVDSLQLPPAEALEVTYGRLKQQGMLTPEIESALNQDASELKKISVSPEYAQAQREALVRLQREGEEGGLTLEDRLANEQALQASATQERGARGAILSNLAERGMAGSGQELAAKLSASQNAANQARMSGLQTASDARKRALQAILQSGDLAGNIRGQEFGEQAKIAEAQDVINKFNIANQQGVQERNVNRGNIAEERNLGEAQRVADANVGLAGRESENRAKVASDLYGMNLDKLSTKGNLITKQGSAANSAGQRYGSEVAETTKGLGDIIHAGKQIFDTETEEEKKKKASQLA